MEPVVIRHDSAPEAFRALSAITDPDYVDCFTMTVPPGHSAEAWTRAAFDAAFLSPKGRFLQRRVLRVRPAATADTVGGWAVGGRGDNWMRLEGDSPLLTSHIIVRVDGDQVAAGMVMRFKSALGAGVWRLASRKHKQVMPVLLRNAHASLAPLAV